MYLSVELMFIVGMYRMAIIADGVLTLIVGSLLPSLALDRLGRRWTMIWGGKNLHTLTAGC